MHPKLTRHKVCINHAHIRENVRQILRLQFATSNTGLIGNSRSCHPVYNNDGVVMDGMTKSGELGALELRVKSAVSLPRAIARRSQAGSLPRRSWWGNFPYNRRSSKWSSPHP